MSIKKNLRTQWFFSQSRDERQIEFWYKNMIVLVVTDIVNSEIKRIEVYSFKHKLHYQVSKIDGFYVGNAAVFEDAGEVYEFVKPVRPRYLTLDDKDEMVRHLEEAWKVRGRPLPPKYQDDWTNAFGIVHDLDIIQSGMLLYPES